MKPIAALVRSPLAAAILLLAAPALGQPSTTTKQKPSALGVSEGDPVPVEVRRPDDEGEIMRTALLPGVAGLDRRVVAYTDSHGVCKGVGVVDVGQPNGDSYGHKHKRAADSLAARVKDKLDASPTTVHDFNVDTLFDEPSDWLEALRRGNVTYTSFWGEEDAAPFQAAYVCVDYGRARVHFEFANFKDCHAEQDAADAAVF